MGERALQSVPPQRKPLDNRRDILMPRVGFRLCVVAIFTGIVAVIIAGPWALAYIALYVLATVPGWPLGRALFGRHHPAGWITGALLGYGLTCLAFWASSPSTRRLSPPSRSRGRSSPASHGRSYRSPWQAARARLPRVEPRRRRARSFFCWLIVPAVFVFPYKNLGAQDAQGNRFYRAYFTADFIWHTALTAELMKYDMPPINPYLGDRTIQYYWTYFLVPAVIAAGRTCRAQGRRAGSQGQRTVLGRAVSRRADSRDVERVALRGGDRHRHCARRAGRQRRRAVHGVDPHRARPIARPFSSTTTSTRSPHGDSMGCGWTASCDPCGTTRITPWPRRSGCSPCRWPVPQAWRRRLARSPSPGSRWRSPRPSIRWSAASSRWCMGPSFSPTRCARVSGARSCVTRLRQRSSVAAVMWCITNDMVEGAANVVIYGFGGLARNAPDCDDGAVPRPPAHSGAARPVAARKASAAHVAQRRGHDSRPSRLLSRQDIEGRCVYWISCRSTAAGRAAWPRGSVFRPSRDSGAARWQPPPPRCSSRSVCRPR